MKDSSLVLQAVQSVAIRMCCLRAALPTTSVSLMCHPMMPMGYQTLVSDMGSASASSAL